jgi:prolyl-tRNA synthetase
MAQELGITVTKSEDIVNWYGQVVVKSEFADYSKVKGCAVIRPLGMSVWENIQSFFNARLKTLGVKNTYFPLFIPESFFHKEAGHVEGFAPEVAWIDSEGKDSEERLAIRPTSETVMYDSYSKWIQSHRDLPLKLNQWCNVVRWEVSDVKIFLRSREFLWQEGHNVFATEAEAESDALTMIREYQHLAHELLATPTFIGLKSKAETFPGAKHTYTIESFMPDGKALQSGTSHNLGQGFAKAFNISFKGTDDKTHHPWQTSWGFSTRLLGAMIMTHSDDKGLILPPRVAPIKAVIIPITIKKKPELSEQVLAKAHELKKELLDAGIEVELDDRDNYSPGFKYSEAELKGTPLRIELGPRDIENNACVMVRRDKGEKESVALEKLIDTVKETLEVMHKELFDKAMQSVQDKKVSVQTFDELTKAIEQKQLAIAHHCGQADCEAQIKAKLQATTRCRIAGEDEAEEGSTCVHCEKKSAYKIIFAKNY